MGMVGFRIKKGDIEKTSLIAKEVVDMAYCFDFLNTSERINTWHGTLKWCREHDVGQVYHGDGFTIEIVEIPYDEEG